MRRLSLDTWLTGAMVPVFGGAFAWSFRMPADAAIFPGLIAGVGLVLCLVALGRIAFGPIEDLPAQEDAQDRKRQAVTTLWIIAFFAVSTLLGFLIGLPLMIVVYYSFEARLPLLRAALGGGGALIFLWVMETQLQIPLYRGLLF